MLLRKNLAEDRNNLGGSSRFASSRQQSAKVSNFSPLKTEESQQFYSKKKADQLEGDEYFKYVSNNFDSFITYLKKNNDLIRTENRRKRNHTQTLTRSKSKDKLTNLIKESQGEIEELSKPFKDLFEEAIIKVSPAEYSSKFHLIFLFAFRPKLRYLRDKSRSRRESTQSQVRHPNLVRKMARNRQSLQTRRR